MGINIMANSLLGLWWWNLVRIHESLYRRRRRSKQSSSCEFEIDWLHARGERKRERSDIEVITMGISCAQSAHGREIPLCLWGWSLFVLVCVEMERENREMSTFLKGRWVLADGTIEQLRFGVTEWAWLCRHLTLILFLFPYILFPILKFLFLYTSIYDFKGIYKHGLNMN